MFVTYTSLRNQITVKGVTVKVSADLIEPCSNSNPSGITSVGLALLLFLLFYALSFFIDCAAPRGTVTEGGIRYAFRRDQTLTGHLPRTKRLSPPSLPPSARACVCAQCPASKLYQKHVKEPVTVWAGRGQMAQAKPEVLRSQRSWTAHGRPWEPKPSSHHTGSII